MKRLFLVSLITLMLIVPMALTAQVTVQKFNHSGEFASFSHSDPSSTLQLTVSRQFDTGTGVNASINYFASSFSADFTSFTFTQIVGTIPGSTFVGQSTQSLVLTLDTSQLDPSAFNQTCTVDLNTFIETCGPGASGSISLSFQENGAQRTRVLALAEEITVGNMTTRIHQRSDNSTANFSGTIFGTSVSGTDGTVGVNHNSSLEYIRN